MSDIPVVHTGEPLAAITDDDVAYRAKLPSWTLTEALFLLSGHKPPGYESTRHMQDHFWNAYTQARLAIRQGDLCQKTEEAGETVGGVLEVEVGMPNIRGHVPFSCVRWKRNQKLTPVLRFVPTAGSEQVVDHLRGRAADRIEGGVEF